MPKMEGRFGEIIRLLAADNVSHVNQNQCSGKIFADLLLKNAMNVI